MFARVVGRSLRHNVVRGLVVAAAFVVAGAASVASGTFYFDAQSKMRAELREYGPNLTITGPLDERYSNAAFRVAVRRVHGVAEVRDRSAVVCGIEPGAAKLYSWWKLDGRWPESTGECVVGKRLARERFIRADQTIDVGNRRLRVVGELDAGGEEDGTLFTTIAVAQELFGRHGRISVVHARVDGDLAALQKLAEAIQKEAPGASAEPVFQIARTEEHVLRRLRGILLLALGAILIASVICAGATVSASIAEREKEIALLLSLGSSRRRILNLFLAETMSAAGAGAIVGVALGVPLAFAFGWKVFGVGLSVRPEIIAVTLAVLAMSATASVLVCARRIGRFEVARALKGE